MGCWLLDTTLPSANLTGKSRLHIRPVYFLITLLVDYGKILGFEFEFERFIFFRRRGFTQKFYELVNSGENLGYLNRTVYCSFKI